VSGQKFCQIFAPALLAAQCLLPFQNKKFVHLAALLATVLIYRHTFSFMFADANPCPSAYALIFLTHFKLVLMSTSALMGSARIIYGKFLELIFTQ
jgi:hypothetical protein